MVWCHFNKWLPANAWLSAVAGIGGLSNGAKRNAKADQLRPVPRHNVNKENESCEDTEPRHCRKLLLPAGHCPHEPMIVLIESIFNLSP